MRPASHTIYSAPRTHEAHHLSCSIAPDELKRLLKEGPHEIVNIDMRDCTFDTIESPLLKEVDGLILGGQGRTSRSLCDGAIVAYVVLAAVVIGCVIVGVNL